MAILPDHKEFLLSQNESETLPKCHHHKCNYFKIWSHNMAYVLGLYCAVGYVYDEKMFNITLRKKDKYILKQVAKELEIQDNVNRQTIEINLECKVIYNDIINLGETEEEVFSKIPKEYLPDFIRGYFDGNGCVMNLKNNRLNSAFACENQEFLRLLLKVLKEEAGIEGGSLDDSCSSLKFGKRDTIRLGNYIYKDNPELFLLRKKQKFFKEEN